MPKKTFSLRGFWEAFKNFAIIFSFVMNFVLLIVLLLVGFILVTAGPGLFNDVVKPMVQTAVDSVNDLENASIDVTVNVSDTIPIKFRLPVSTQTNVRTTGPVPLSTNATFMLPGGGGSIRGSVNIVLPQGLVLPVQLSIEVPVSQTIPIQMQIPVSIKLKETELGEIFQRLRVELVEPLTDPILKRGDTE